MKRFLILMVIILAVAGGVFFIVFRHASQTQQRPTLDWLKTEYKLDQKTFDAIQRCHNDYQSKCSLLCQKVDESNQKLNKLLSGATHLTPEISATLSENAQVRAECQKAMLEHLFEIASLMPPEQGKRYLSTMTEHMFEPSRSVEKIHEH